MIFFPAHQRLTLETSMFLLQVAAQGMMPGSARASLLLQAHSISSRQSSPRGAVASRNEKLLLFILALGAVLGLVTFWKAGDITLPAITANTALQEAPGEASLRPVLSRRMVDGGVFLQSSPSS